MTGPEVIREVLEDSKDIQLQRYVIEYLDAGGTPLVAYYKTTTAAELFFGTLHGRGLQFYSEEVVHSTEEFEVFRRVKQFYPPEK